MWFHSYLDRDTVSNYRSVVKAVASLQQNVLTLRSIMCGPSRVPHHRLHELAMPGKKRKFECRKKVTLPPVPCSTGQKKCT